MKILFAHNPAPAAGSRLACRAQAFTVAEMMVSVFIFTFMVLGIIYTFTQLQQVGLGRSALEAGC